MSCGYTGSHFGARYDDAVCIDGYLWDLDSGDADGLTHGGEFPCPQCQLDAWISSIIEDISTLMPEPGQHLFPMITAQLMAARRLHPLDSLFAAMNGKTLPFWLHADEDDEPDALIAWPWPLDGYSLSAHDVMPLEAIDLTDAGFAKEGPYWIKLSC